MEPRKASAAWRRAVQIAVLGLVWGIGILALVSERAGSGPAHAARTAKRTAVR